MINLEGKTIEELQLIRSSIAITTTDLSPQDLETIRLVDTRMLELSRLPAMPTSLQKAIHTKIVELNTEGSRRMQTFQGHLDVTKIGLSEEMLDFIEKHEFQLTNGGDIKPADHVKYANRYIKYYDTVSAFNKSQGFQNIKSAYLSRQLQDVPISQADTDIYNFACARIDEQSHRKQCLHIIESQIKNCLSIDTVQAFDFYNESLWI